MGQKYEFTGEIKKWNEHTLHRIKRISDGKIGGWVENEANLSQEGNCWVDNDAKIYGDARVYGNANVYGDASVYGDAKVYDNARVYGSAQVYAHANAYGYAEVYDKAKVYDYAKVYDNARVYGSAQVGCSAWVYDNACVHGNAQVYDYAEVYGDAKVYGNAIIADTAKVCDDVAINDEADLQRCAHYDKTPIDNSIEEPIKDFIYKVDDSNKLSIQTRYDSVEAFFEDDSDKSYCDHESICILAIDTKIPIIKLEKTEDKGERGYKFIVDITNESGDIFSIKSIIDSKDKFSQLLQSTIDALNSYPQFSKYANDLTD